MMNKKLLRVLLAVVVVGALALTGCAATQGEDEAVDKTRVRGYVASADSAQLEVATAVKVK